MTDTIKILEPEVVSDTAFPQGQAVNTNVTTPTSGGVAQTPKTSDNFVPTKKIAVELLSTVINTKSRKVLRELQLVDQGAFRVGKYENGVSGEVVMTPDGIAAKNKSGIQTFVLLAEDGSAVFAGEVQSGAFISGLVEVGDGDIVIDGSSKRMVFYNNGIPAIVIGQL